MDDGYEASASHNSPPSHESVDATDTTAQGNLGADDQGDTGYLGHQNMLLLQHMSGMIQNAMAQMEQRMDAKLASKSGEMPPPPTGPDIGSNRGTDESTRRERSDRVSFKTFKTCGATEFSGAIDPIEAYDWLSTMEKVFDISHCWDTDRVTYAAAMFTGRALEWWKNTSKFMGAEQRKAMTWESFTETFLQQYCPPDLQRKYTREFLELKQGDMTVEAYETEFHRKAKFATQYLGSEKERIAHFVEGLRDDIQEFVEIREITTLAKAAEYARQREQTLSRRSSTMPPPKRPFRDSHSSAPSFSQSSRHPAPSRPHSQTPAHSFSHSVSQARISL